MLNERLHQLRCEQFAREGAEFSQELHSENVTHFSRCTNRFQYFDMALSIGLAWTKHAKPTREFFAFATDSLASSNDIDQDAIASFSWRFGPSSLFVAMSGLRVLRNEIGPLIPDLSACDAKALKIFQEDSLDKLKVLRTRRSVTGVGPWLFLGPFKIIIGNELRFWDDPNIDAVLLPTGLEVRKGIRKLIDQNSPLAGDFKREWLVNEEQSLEEGIGIDLLIQNRLKTIADRANTRVLHINSAFYLYGRE